MDGKKNVTFIVNPVSGTRSKRHIVELIPRYMPEDRFDCRIVYTDHCGHAAEIAQQASCECADVVVAVGGDGTVNEVARSLAHTQTALGIIPCGSGNGLARHLFIPMNPAGALKVLSECHIETLDYGMINETPFFCTCGVGFDAFVSYKFAQKNRRGLLTYIETTLSEGLKYKPETYDVEIDGEKQSFKAFVIACANASQYGNNAYIAPHASMSDGLMDVTVMEPFNMLEAGPIAFQLFNKTITQNSKIRTFKCKHVVIHRSRPGVIHFDGDPKEESADLDVRLIEHGIRMVINDKEQIYTPPMLGVFQDVYNDVHGEFKHLEHEIRERQQKVITLNRDLLNKLRGN